MINRRRFLAILLGMGLFSGAGWLVKRLLFSGSEGFDQQAVWRHWIDHLIPEDDTPGAIQLGVEKQILAKPEYPDLIRDGTKWLHKQAMTDYGKGFVELGVDQTERIVEMAANAKQGSLPNSFFLYTRLETMRLYYADPRSRVATIWEQNPQPLGHPDYQQPCRHG